MGQEWPVFIIGFRDYGKPRFQGSGDGATIVLGIRVTGWFLSDSRHTVDSTLALHKDLAVLVDLPPPRAPPPPQPVPVQPPSPGSSSSSRSSSSSGSIVADEKEWIVGGVVFKDASRHKELRRRGSLWDECIKALMPYPGLGPAIRKYLEHVFSLLRTVDF